jgi:nucleotide-binding universal stress UspA family protein
MMNGSSNLVESSVIADFRQSVSWQESVVITANFHNPAMPFHTSALRAEPKVPVFLNGINIALGNSGQPGPRLFVRRKVMAQTHQFRQILYPTDAAPQGHAPGFPYAVALSQSYGAELGICHCIDEPSLDNDCSSVICECEKRVAELVLRSGSAGANLDWRCGVKRGEDVGETIRREAAEQKSDLIVLSRGKNQPAGLLGSTVESVSRTAPCPVLVIPTCWRQWVTARDDVRIARVLVPYDFSDESELAMRYGLSFAQQYKGELHLLHVLHTLESFEVDSIGRFVSRHATFDETVRKLQTAVPKEARLGCDIKDSVRWGMPFREVLAYAEDYGIDLICMGSRGAGYGMQSLFGSNTDRVLRQAACPVLIARPFTNLVRSI